MTSFAEETYFRIHNQQARDKLQAQLEASAKKSDLQARAIVDAAHPPEAPRQRK